MTRVKVPAADHPRSKLESLWTLVKPDGKRQLIFGSVYRPPRHTVADLKADFADLENQFQYLVMNFPSAKIVLFGDLNCDLLKLTSDPAKTCLTQFLSDFSLSQCVSSFTYSSGSLLDILAVSSNDLVSRCGTRFCHFSPHRFVRAFISVPRSRLPPVVVRSRCLRRIDVPAFHRDLFNADWATVFLSHTVTDKWQCFISVFIPIVDSHAPIRASRIRNPHAPVICDDTRELMTRRRDALARFGHGSVGYRDLNRAVRSALRRDTREGVQRKIQEAGARSVWRCLGAVVGSGRPGRVTPNASPDELNSYFVSVGPRVAGEVAALGEAQVPCRLPRVGACALSLTPLTLAELRAIVAGMSGSSACGEDGVCVRLVRLSFDIIGPIFLHLVNSSLMLSDVPLSWKHSIVHPIFKSGDHTQPSNYRPISIVPVIAKIVERAVHQQLYGYLSHNHLLSSTQHGFRPGHSTETALTSISDHILSANDRGEISLLCLL